MKTYKVTYNVVLSATVDADSREDAIFQAGREWQEYGAESELAGSFGLDHADRWPLCSYMTCQHNRAFLASLEVVDAAGNRGVNNG